MPIPTDTYWNIKKLNVVFAASAVLLVLVTLWAIFQDFNQGWREPQRHGKIWQAAFVDDKIQRDTTPELQAEIARLQQQQAELNRQLGPDTPQTKARTARPAQVTMEIAKRQVDVEALKKKREALVPRGLIANLSEKVRDAPLMQFINPAERPIPLFLPEVLTSLGGVKEVTTVDKCVT